MLLVSLEIYKHGCYTTTVRNVLSSNFQLMVNQTDLINSEVNFTK